MIVSHTYKLAYIPIEKNAHSSLTRWMADLDGKVEKSAPSDYLVFAAVRGPVNRFMSAYIDKFINKYLKNDYNKNYSARKLLEHIGMKKDIPDVRLMDVIEAINRENIRNCDNHFRLQSEFIKPYTQNDVLFVRVENLNECMGILCDKLGLPEFGRQHDDNIKEYRNFKDDLLPFMTVKDIADKYGCLPSKGSFLTKDIKSRITYIYNEDLQWL